jgi:hypothetical protein
MTKQHLGVVVPIERIYDDGDGGCNSPPLPGTLHAPWQEKAKRIKWTLNLLYPPIIRSHPLVLKHPTCNSLKSPQAMSNREQR